MLVAWSGMGLLQSASVRAQTADGNTGINQATTLVNSYFASATNLMYAVGALIGLIGAIQVFRKFLNHDRDTGHAAAAWFGSCVFLVLVATVLKSFFGIA